MGRVPGVDRGTTGLRQRADPPVLLNADGNQGWKPLLGVRISKDRNLDCAVPVTVQTRMDDRVVVHGVATVGIADRLVCPSIRKRGLQVRRYRALILFSSVRNAVAIGVLVPVRDTVT